MIYKDKFTCFSASLVLVILLVYFRLLIAYVASRDSNPGPVFTIPGFRIEKVLIPGSQQDYIVGHYFSKLNKSRLCISVAELHDLKAFIHGVHRLYLYLSCLFSLFLLYSYVSNALHRVTIILLAGEMQNW